MRHYLLAGAAVTLLAGCGQEERREPKDVKSYDVQQSVPLPDIPAPAEPPPPPVMSAPPMARVLPDEVSDGAGPDVSVTAAPGVAFNYRYAYRLANERIQAAQEAHAQMCEKLTVARCRITGMRYTLTGERDISGSLEIKLDPSIARQFGKDATKVITDAKGILVDQQTSGTDMGSTIASANRGRAGIQDDLDRVNRELGRSGLSNVVRDRLLSEAAELRAQIRALGEQKKEAEDSLATTPMSFSYGSGVIAPSTDEEKPIARAFATAGLNFERAAAFLIIAGAALLPWALMAGLVIWLWRRFQIGAWLNARSDVSYARQVDPD